MSHDESAKSVLPQEQNESSLKSRVYQGSLWTLIGYGSSQVLRLGGNLLLTRLLTPEAFGLMALVQTFLSGLQMFSDFGIFPNIVQSPRGEDPKFLNTAWTIQAIRGVILMIGAFLIAVPAAQIYREPLLMQLLPISGLTALIGGLASTKLATANRRLALQRLIVIELGTYAISLLVMLTAAWVYRSVWVLVFGSIVGSLLKTIASHTLLAGERNFFCWDQESAQEIKQFGRWIFISTIIAFFALQGDRLIFGWLINVRFLGIYAIALGLSSIVEQVVEQVNSKVLFPSYAELLRERPSELYRVLRKARFVLLLLSAAFAVFLVLCGQWVIDLLYDDRYLDAGWILQILSVGYLGRILSITYGDVLMAKGQTLIIMRFTITFTCIQFASMFVGFFFAGSPGVVVGIAIAEWLTYLVYAAYFARLSLWQPELDFPIVLLGGLLTTILC